MRQTHTFRNTFGSCNLEKRKEEKKTQHGHTRTAKNLKQSNHHKYKSKLKHTHLIPPSLIEMKAHTNKWHKSNRIYSLKSFLYNPSPPATPLNISFSLAYIFQTLSRLVAPQLVHRLSHNTLWSSRSIK